METVHMPIDKTLGQSARSRKLKRVLVIDPDEDSALFAALSKKGCDLARCDSVREAWDWIYPRRPQLIILRLNNLNRDVLSEFRECRILAEGAPMILALASPAKPDLIRALKRGGSAVLVAPPTAEKIREALERLERSTRSASRPSVTVRLGSRFQGE